MTRALSLSIVDVGVRPVLGGVIGLSMPPATVLFMGQVGSTVRCTVYGVRCTYTPHTRPGSRARSRFAPCCFSGDGAVSPPPVDIDPQDLPPAPPVSTAYRPDRRVSLRGEPPRADGTRCRRWSRDTKPDPPARGALPLTQTARAGCPASPATSPSPRLPVFPSPRLPVSPSPRLQAAAVIPDQVAVRNFDSLVLVQL